MKKHSKKKYQRFHIRLSHWDRKKISLLLRDPTVNVRMFRRAMILRLLDQERSVISIAAELSISPMSVRRVGVHYFEAGLERALYDEPRSGKPAQISNTQEKEIIALVCSAPPGERSRWTLKLLQEEVIRRKIRPSIGRETLRLIINEAEVKPWLEKNVVRRNFDRRIHQKNDQYPSTLREEI